ncbi:hypothetical protein [Psychrobacter maritimus]|uniref:hypothetical protein n=1 Tax=Psychrobacter maritimus TaxID=256325 RepID=UPI003FD1B204
MKNSNCIIITQKEWLNWLAFGYLRISPSRISYFDNTESGFDKLMSLSVDHALDEEDAYLIASLVNDYSCKELYVKRTLFSDYISIQAVRGFYSLSIKGRDLLEYEVEQSHSILNHDSKIEKLWSEWKNTQFRLRNHDKGNKFLEILDYQKFEVEPKVDDDTLFNRVLKNYNRRNLHSKLQDRHKRSSFAWLVINQEFNEKIGKILYRKYYDFRKNSQNVEIQDIAKTYKFLEDSFITNDSDSLFDYPLLIAEKSFFDKWHSDNSEPKEHYLASTILVHYYNILESNYDINLLSLSKDLTLLDKIDSPEDISQLIAYFIGRRLNEVYLNSLYIAKNIEQKNLVMFNTNFFSNKKKEKLTLCNIDQAQLKNIINKVHLTSEEIQLAYNNIEVSKIQEPEIGSETIENSDSNLNQSIQSQKPIENNDNIKIDNIPLKEKEDIPSNTTNDEPTQPHPEAKKLVESEESEDTTNKTGDSNQPTQSQATIIDSSNIETNNSSLSEKEDISSNITDNNSNQPHSEAQNPVESEEHKNGTNRIDDENEDSTEPVYSEGYLSNSKKKVVNQTDENLDLFTAIHSDPIDKEILIGAQPIGIDESETGSKSDQPDSDYYMNLAIDIHDKLSRENNNKFKDFIIQFFKGIDDLTKSKLKHNNQPEFFYLFGELIGDKNNYKDITYSKFRAILKKKKNLG